MKIYLASPYSNKKESVRLERFNAVNKKAAELMEHGYTVFSPISHSHPISLKIKNEMILSFWLEQDLSFLDTWADEMWVLMLDGWKESKGIAVEILHAEKIGLPVRYITQKTVINRNPDAMQ